MTITSLHGVHGAPVSEAALAGMFTLARDIPRFVRNQDTQPGAAGRPSSCRRRPAASSASA